MVRRLDEVEKQRADVDKLAGQMTAGEKALKEEITKSIRSWRRLSRPLEGIV